MVTRSCEFEAVNDGRFRGLFDAVALLLSAFFTEANYAANGDVEGSLAEADTRISATGSLDFASADFGHGEPQEIDRFLGN